jgi:uncharacterized protein
MKEVKNMAVRRDDNGERSVETSVEVPGSPEEDRRVIDRSMTRRNALSLVALSFTTLLGLGCTRPRESATWDGDRSPDDPPNKNEVDTYYGGRMRVHYLEIVTTDVDTVCALYAQLHGVTFGDADPDLGGARTARLASGGMLGVRAPLNDGERLVVRPYILVENIEAAVVAAAESGATISLPPMEIPGHGTCAIVFQGGIESGLWQV